MVEGAVVATLLKPIVLLSMVFVATVVVVGVAEYYIVHNIDESNMSSDSATTEAVTTAKATTTHVITTRKSTTTTKRATTTTTSVAPTTTEPVDLYALPEGFIMASATSAYQVEGAWNVSDKGVSIWDTYTHTYMTSTGDDACKSYYLYKRDVEMVKKTGFNAYRFSISWSRVLPNGTSDYISSDGVQYYNNLLDELINNNITPLVTLYHWDLPQALDDMGGWLNASIADWFHDYANVCFDQFGSKVKWWITINEPELICSGYSSTRYAPALNDSGISDYIANHNMLRAHAKVYHLYNNTYKPTQNGYVGMTYSIPGVTPSNSSDPEDVEAADRAWQWNLGVYAHPIYSLEGNYPTIVRERVDNNSYAEGRNESRLPHFTPEELEEMRGAYDFIGVNHYASSAYTKGISGTNPSIRRDSEAIPGSGGLSGGEGLRAVLNWIKTMYNDPPIIITENGLRTDSGLNDSKRITSYHSFIKGVLEAIYLDGCNVLGYTAWALMDNMEWSSGYGPKYGIWQVDFSDPNRTRTMKESGYWFQEMLSTWRLPNTSDIGAFTEASSTEASTTTEPADLYALPPGFIMGASTSAYQVEGAWNVTDKGESIWDRFTHNNLTYNGDDACKSYELYRRDVEMVKLTGFNAYRFSISWSRVLPNGTSDYISSDGVQYYNNLLDELLANNITPLVTLYHFDLPQALEDKGGWLNSSAAVWFRDYANVCFNEFGTKVKWWITINEPAIISLGYGTAELAPGLNDSGVSDYLATHNILRAHAKAYHLYNDTYKSAQNGSVGMSFSIDGVMPQNSSDPDDVEAADRMWQWEVGIFAHPIYSLEGNYPTIVRERVDNNSYAEGRNESRLPSFTPEELEELRGSYDFIGVNSYGSHTATKGVSGVNPSMSRDSGAVYGNGTVGKGEGFRLVLNWLKVMYNDPPILITENGCNTTAGLEDTERIYSYHSFMMGVLEAIYLDGCNVLGYTAWGLMDTLEWTYGYQDKMGIWQVDFSDPNRTRTMKESGYWFQEMLSTWRLPNTSYTGAFTEGSTLSTVMIDT